MGIVYTLQSIFHTRLRLNNGALYYDLSMKNCVDSPACTRCGADVEAGEALSVVLPNFLIYAALRTVLLTSASPLLGDRWSLASDKKKIKWLLNGNPNVDLQTTHGKTHDLLQHSTALISGLFRIM